MRLSKALKFPRQRAGNPLVFLRNETYEITCTLLVGANSSPSHDLRVIDQLNSSTLSTHHRSMVVRSARSYTTVLCMHHSTWKLLFRHCSIRVSSMDPLIFMLDSALEPEIKGRSTRSGVVQTGQSNFLDFITSPILLKNIYYSTYLKNKKTAKD
jgi:hypothetical protein